MMTDTQNIETTGMNRGLLVAGAILLGALIIGGYAGGLFTSEGGKDHELAGTARVEDETLDPPRQGQVPTGVMFTERSGRSVDIGEFRGEAWIASFIFTRCQGTCPLMTAALKELQAGLDEQGTPIKLVSFTVDPEHDSPEKLAEYADGYQADERWLFLTAPDSVVQPLALETFKLGIEEGSDPKEPIIHSSRFVLIDASGEIRGYFEGRSEEGRESLMKRVKVLEDRNEL